MIPCFIKVDVECVWVKQVRSDLSNHFNSSGTIFRHQSDCNELLDDFEEVIAIQFFPALYGGDITSAEHGVFSFPAHMGDLGIMNPLLFFGSVTYI